MEVSMVQDSEHITTETGGTKRECWFSVSVGRETFTLHTNSRELHGIGKALVEAAEEMDSDLALQTD